MARPNPAERRQAKHIFAEAVTNYLEPRGAERPSLLDEPTGREKQCGLSRLGVFE